MTSSTSKPQLTDEELWARDKTVFLMVMPWLTVMTKENGKRYFLPAFLLVAALTVLLWVHP